MYKSFCTVALIALSQSTHILANSSNPATSASPSANAPAPNYNQVASSDQSSSSPKPGGVEKNGTANSSSNSSLPHPKIIPLNCNQAFMPLQDENATTAMNITECACKAFETPNGAFCEAESCKDFAVCQTCNQIMVGATPNTTITSNVTVATVECRNNYFLPAPNDTDRRALCTDFQDRSYTCTGACKSGASCAICISMDDPALMGPGPN